MSAADDDQLEELEDGFVRTMSFVYETSDPEHEADLLEALCEGFVRANQIMIRAQEDAYPCCLGCGNYAYVPPASCQVYDRQRRKTVADGSCQKVLGAAQLHRTGKGTCIDLACYLCALKREKDGLRSARVGIDYQFNPDVDGEIQPGKYHAIVVVPQGEGQADVILDPQQQLEELAERRAASELVQRKLEVGAGCGCGASPDQPQAAGAR